MKNKNPSLYAAHTIHRSEEHRYHNFNSCTQNSCVYQGSHMPCAHVFCIFLKKKITKKTYSETLTQGVSYRSDKTTQRVT